MKGEKLKLRVKKGEKKERERKPIPVTMMEKIDYFKVSCLVLQYPKNKTEKQSKDALVKLIIYQFG